MIAVLDTCALVWAALSPVEMTPAARAVVEDPANDFLVSSISLWEIALKVKRGRLDLGMPVRGFVHRLESMGNMEIVAVTTQLWLRSVELEWEHPDPADRIIVATADLRGVPIVTADTRIRGYYANVVW